MMTILEELENTYKNGYIAISEKLYSECLNLLKVAASEGMSYKELAFNDVDNLMENGIIERLVNDGFTIERSSDNKIKVSGWAK